MKLLARLVLIGIAIYLIGDAMPLLIGLLLVAVLLEFAGWR